MGKFLSSGFLGFLCSTKATGEKDSKGRNIMVEDFQSGFNGWGWKIWSHFVGRDAEGNIRKRYKMSIDDMEVRGTMTIFELLIQKIRALKGYLGITQGNGQVKTVESDENNFYLKMEDENSFLKDDFIRCQRSDKNGKGKGYWVKVAGIDAQDRVVIPKTEFTVIEGEIDEVNIPAPGDEVVQFGNETDPKRQSAIFLHVDSDGNPAIDIMFGISTKSFEGCTKVRLGGELLGEPGKTLGFYCENGMILSKDSKDNVIYKLSPDGYVNLGKGKIVYNPQTDKLTFGKEVTLNWSGVEDIPGWIGDVTKNTTQIGSDYIISPKIFSGTRDANNKVLTGVAMGKGVIEVDGVSKSGLFGIKDGKLTFSIDADTGDVDFSGDLITKAIKADGLNIEDNFIVDKDGFVNLSGKLSAKGNGNKIVVNTLDNSIKMYNKSDVLIFDLFIAEYNGATYPELHMVSYVAGGGKRYEIDLYSDFLRFTTSDTNGYDYTTTYADDNITMSKYDYRTDITKKVELTVDSLIFRNNGSITKQF